MNVNRNRLVQLASRRKMGEMIFDELTGLLAAKRTGFLFEDERLGLYAESLADSVFITNQTIPDCLTCGACCAYFHQILISIEDGTPRSLAWEVADADGQTLHWLRREPDEARCIAFEGKIGEPVNCSIYELRPTACRAFEAGSDRCHALRRMFGLEPQLSERERQLHRQTLPTKTGANDELVIEDEWAEGFNDKFAQADFLRELINYNLAKLKNIVTELQRLKLLLNERGAAETQEKCVQAFEIASHEIELINQERARVNLPEGFASLNEVGQDHLINRLLAIGNRSQAALESAAEHLAAIGELAFAALGMNARFP